MQRRHNDCYRRYYTQLLPRVTRQCRSSGNHEVACSVPAARATIRISGRRQSAALLKGRHQLEIVLRLTTDRGGRWKFRVDDGQRRPWRSFDPFPPNNHQQKFALGGSWHIEFNARNAKWCGK